MDVQQHHADYTPPPREWPGFDYELYFDEAQTALLSHTSAVEVPELAEEAQRLLAELSSLSAYEVLNESSAFAGRRIEVEGIPYTLNEVIGAGDDGVYFAADGPAQSGVLKISWPFNPSRQTGSDLDSYRMESALLERQALMEISHAPDIVSFEAPFILPRLFSEGVIVVENDSERTCSSVLFMEELDGVSFDTFLNIVEETGSLRDFVSVTLSALNAQFHLADLGDPEEPQRGIYRMDNGVHNLLVNMNNGATAVCLDYGSCSIPAFTGEAGNPSLSQEENAKLRFNLAVEQLRRSLASSLRESTLEHSEKDAVLQLLERSGSVSPEELYDSLKSMQEQLNVSENQEQSQALADSDVINLSAYRRSKGSKTDAA